MFYSSTLKGHNFIQQIYDFKPIRLPAKSTKALPMVFKYIDGKGVSRVAGASGLKLSQAYTPQLLSVSETFQL